MEAIKQMLENMSASNNALKSQLEKTKLKPQEEAQVSEIETQVKALEEQCKPLKDRKIAAECIEIFLAGNEQVAKAVTDHIKSNS